MNLTTDATVYASTAMLDCAIGFKRQLTRRECAAIASILNAEPAPRAQLAQEFIAAFEYVRAVEGALAALRDPRVQAARARYRMACR